MRRTCRGARRWIERGSAEQDAAILENERRQSGRRLAAKKRGTRGRDGDARSRRTEHYLSHKFCACCVRVIDLRDRRVGVARVHGRARTRCSRAHIGLHKSCAECTGCTGDVSECGWIGRRARDPGASQHDAASMNVRREQKRDDCEHREK